MGPNLPSDAAIEKFWEWFVSAAPKLAQKSKPAALSKRLSTEVARLGDMQWELGPGQKAKHAFTLSPDGDVDWLPVTERIVARAPHIPGWELYSARPPRVLGTFSVENDEGTEQIEIDGSSWRYVLQALPDGMFDLLLEQGNLPKGMSESERYTAALHLVNGVLGEATFLSRIDTVEPVLRFSAKQKKGATSVAGLAEHLHSLLNG